MERSYIENAFKDLEEMLEGDEIEPVKKISDEPAFEEEHEGTIRDLFEKEGSYILTHKFSINSSEYNLFIEALGGSGAESCDVLYDSFEIENIKGVLVELLDDDFDFIDSLANYAEKDFTLDTSVSELVDLATAMVEGTAHERDTDDEFDDSEEIVPEEEPVEKVESCCSEKKNLAEGFYPVTLTFKNKESFKKFIDRYFGHLDKAGKEQKESEGIVNDDDTVTFHFWGWSGLMFDSELSELVVGDDALKNAEENARKFSEENESYCGKKKNLEEGFYPMTLTFKNKEAFKKFLDRTLEDKDSKEKEESKGIVNDDGTVTHHFWGWSGILGDPEISKLVVGDDAIKNERENSIKFHSKENESMTESDEGVDSEICYDIYMVKNNTNEFVNRYSSMEDAIEDAKDMFENGDCESIDVIRTHRNYNHKAFGPSVFHKEKEDESLIEADNTTGNMKFGDRKTPKKHVVKESAEEGGRFEYCVIKDGNNTDCFNNADEAIKFAKESSADKVLLVNYAEKDEYGDEAELGTEAIWEKEDEALTESTKVNLRNDEDLEKAQKILNSNEEPKKFETVVDMTAETAEQAESNDHIGQALLRCPVCKTLFYVKLEDLIEPEEKSENKLYTFKTEDGTPSRCPHCGAEEEFECIGQIASLDSQDAKKAEEEKANEENEEEQPEENNNIESIPEEPIEEPKETEDVAIEFDEIPTEEENESLEGSKLKSLVEDFDEKSFDRLARRYLKEVYENIENYQTVDGMIDNNGKIKLEGIITFTSGRTKRTTFVFETKETTKKGKLRLVGLNETFSKAKKAFTLVANLEDKKLLGESLTYNYNVNGIQKIYGRII